ncbi:hypothetical protein WISP_65606 [Willisornis vidua]|uniref:Uncharacterized protein n=1 Tax=Willisornis vidua TaxID=1566151 RepID=A0ABQ9D956_9PASS|nr:hypothetical protein WISP_65606 [Willisornis vidua]
MPGFYSSQDVPKFDELISKLKFFPKLLQKYPLGSDMAKMSIWHQSRLQSAGVSPSPDLDLSPDLMRPGLRTKKKQRNVHLVPTLSAVLFPNLLCAIPFAEAVDTCQFAGAAFREAKHVISVLSSPSPKPLGTDMKHRAQPFQRVPGHCGPEMLLWSNRFQLPCVLGWAWVKPGLFDQIFSRHEVELMCSTADPHHQLCKCHKHSLSPVPVIGIALALPVLLVDPQTTLNPCHH